MVSGFRRRVDRPSDCRINRFSKEAWKADIPESAAGSYLLRTRLLRSFARYTLGEDWRCKELFACCAHAAEAVDNSDLSI
uniref:Uncharacterized protein n=1 Tax=Tanacetum cinerariifolium TaxID=118510 RepID=A0A699XGB0_TANCI|nr:hypothetical protein [Tanacetum cinerariifolium]